MSFQIEYFHERVLAEIESWPVDVLADYARLIELLIGHGPSLRLPHSRAFGDGLFELRLRGRSGIGRAFYCFLLGKRGDPACVHQEDTTNARARAEDRAKAPQGSTPWLT